MGLESFVKTNGGVERRPDWGQRIRRSGVSRATVRPSNVSSHSNVRQLYRCRIVGVLLAALTGSVVVAGGQHNVREVSEAHSLFQSRACHNVVRSGIVNRKHKICMIVFQ